jgi:hypothetical protein
VTQGEAKRQILKEWRSWVRDKEISEPKGADALMFFGYLQQHRSDLLRFRYEGDKWQRVKSWLGVA